MSSNPHDEPRCQNAEAMHQIETPIVPRVHDLGDFEARRPLSSFKHQMVGPFIFFDQMRSDDKERYRLPSRLNLKENFHMPLISNEETRNTHSKTIRVIQAAPSIAGCMFLSRMSRGPKDPR